MWSKKPMPVRARGAASRLARHGGAARGELARDRGPGLLGSAVHPHAQAADAEVGRKPEVGVAVAHHGA
jgi:hypothetical protein